MANNSKVELLDSYCRSNPTCNSCAIYEVFPRCNQTEFCEMSEKDIQICYRAMIDGHGEQQFDNVNHPSHYQGKHECIDEMIALFGVEAVKHFCMCNVYKYRYRAEAKNGAEDIAKAEWYMDKLMELNGERDG